MNRIVMLVAVALTSMAAQANPTQVFNGILASKEGRSLYTFDRDAAGKSSCYGGCAAAWPPFVVADPALAGGDFSIVGRDDGRVQWAFKGRPLYFFAADARPGEVRGDGNAGAWHAVRRPATGAARAAETVGELAAPAPYSYGY
jgi:predicted lipoprotein with Yx(FWY)xxD motif